MYKDIMCSNNFKVGKGCGVKSLFGKIQFHWKLFILVECVTILSHVWPFLSDNSRQYFKILDWIVFDSFWSFIFILFSFYILISYMSLQSWPAISSWPRGRIGQFNGGNTGHYRKGPIFGEWLTWITIGFNLEK